MPGRRRIYIIAGGNQSAGAVQSRIGRAYAGVVRTMITKKDQDIIKECARKYHVLAVLLFGSSVSWRYAADIDLAVRGIKPESFFHFYAELFRQLPRPVDLVDLDAAESYFAGRILEEGKVIYEA